MEEYNYILRCANNDCGLTQLFYVNDLGHMVKIDTNSHIIAYPMFLKLTTHTQQKPISPIKLRESIMTIWGCESCKSLTYTNCTIERTDDYSESKIINIR